MKTNKDPKGLITQDSIIVAPQELNDDTNWTLVESKQTRKQSSGTPRTITIKNIDLIKKEEKSTNSEDKEAIDISSSTDSFEDLTSISESTTEDRWYLYNRNKIIL